MKKQDRRHTRRGLRSKAVAIAAGTLALTLGTTVAASANGGTGSLGTASGTTVHTAPQQGRTTFSAGADAGSTWMFGIDGRDSAGNIWDYPPNAKGGFGTKTRTGTGMGSASAFFKINSANTEKVNVYARFGSQLRMYGGSSSAGTVIGSGWSGYNAFVTPGNLGGAANPDLLARDTSGVMWEYLSYSNGTFAGRIRVGGGWQIYKDLAGFGDLTGDGKADIVARDAAGGLWLYKGTGNSKAPLASRVQIGTGWNVYNRLVGLGDNNADGRYDLIARRTDGVLFFFPGTGNAAKPFGGRQQIGTGWGVFNYLF
ncbi:FG-GAP repeat domain-containing protein [Streptomyces sp. NPDC049040]|uniref:FG-GAP repeat domain-containing protein n=1 Tax=Streptomyces sp. NPDC049040 TaxID=3365593 RepID=UPI0037219D9B